MVRTTFIATARACCATLRRLARDRSGAFAIFTALALPTLVIMMGVVCEAGYFIAQKRVAKQVTMEACARAVKPTRTRTPLDSVRQKQVLDLFDAAAKGGRLTVKSRSATIDWLTVKIDAVFVYTAMFTKIVGVTKVDFPISTTCVGIPPYPHDGEVILDSNFVKPTGASIPLKQLHNCPNSWDIFKYSDFGWDRGDGPGVEIQDWSDPKCFGALPATGYPSSYVVELDSNSNSWISKYIELHPGKYKFSLWYIGRVNEVNKREETNKIDVYLQKTRPTPEPVAKVIFSLNADLKDGWLYKEIYVDVKEYSVYELFIAAAGRSDSYGGRINAFSVRYVDTQ